MTKNKLDPNSETGKARAAIAAALGESPEAITATDPKWLQLMQNGVLVRLHIGRWRAKAPLSWADLGLQDESSETDQDQLKEILSLGYKRLLPAHIIKNLDRIDSRARKWLEAKAYKTHWGFFLPATAYSDWKEKNAEFEAEYLSARDTLLTSYEAVKVDLFNGYYVAARRAYDTFKALAPGRLAKFKNRGEFIESFLAGIESHIPTAQEIADSFYYQVDLEYIPLPSQLAADQAQADRLQAEGEAARAAAYAEAEKQRAEAYAARETAEAEAMAARSAAQVKELQLREMNRDVVEAARRQKQALVDSFLSDVVTQLRGLVYEATTDVLGAIQKKDSLPPRSVVQLKKLIEQVEGLNFYGDSEVESMIAKIQPQIDRAADDRDLVGLADNLKNIGTVIRASLVDLGQRPRSARRLGITDDPGPADLDRARRGLGLAEVAPLESGRQPRLAPAGDVVEVAHESRLKGKWEQKPIV